MSVNVNQHERDDGRPAIPAAERPLVRRDHDEQLLTARLVTSRHPGRWVSAAVVLLLFAMGVHTVVTNPRFQWGLVGDYAKIFSKWGVAGTDEITKSTLNPAPTF
jgi:hypothetical protein